MRSIHSVCPAHLVAYLVIQLFASVSSRSAVLRSPPRQPSTGLVELQAEASVGTSAEPSTEVGKRMVEVRVTAVLVSEVGFEEVAEREVERLLV